MRVKDAKSLRKKFNLAFFLAKQVCPFSGYPHLIELKKKKGIQNVKFFYCTDCAVAIFTNYIGTVIKNKTYQINKKLQVLLHSK